MATLKVIKFGAKWCGPCKAYAPMFEAVKNELGDKAQFLSYDIDESEDLVETFEVRAVPTTLVVRDDIVVERILGNITKEALRALVMEHLGTAVSI